MIGKCQKCGIERRMHRDHKSMESIRRIDMTTWKPAQKLFLSEEDTRDLVSEKETRDWLLEQTPGTILGVYRLVATMGIGTEVVTTPVPASGPKKGKKK